MEIGTISHHPRALPPMPAVVRILSQFERPQLAGFIEVAISLLDTLDGDPDVEANGDEIDGTNGEDEAFYGTGGNAWAGPSGAGCPISDPGGTPLDPGEADQSEGAHCLHYGIDQTQALRPGHSEHSWRS